MHEPTYLCDRWQASHDVPWTRSIRGAAVRACDGHRLYLLPESLWNLVCLEE